MYFDNQTQSKPAMQLGAWIAVIVLSFAGTLMPAGTRKNPSASNAFLASETTPKCWALDVVMLIDQSGSMTGDHGSDPDAYRFEAAREVLDQLIQNRQEQCIEAVHRIGVVTFSDNATVFMPLKPITLHSEDDPDVWAEQYVELIEQAENSYPGDQTNFEAGFEAVKTVFSQATKMDEPQDYGPRRQVIIFITDGFPTIDLYGQQPTTSVLMCSLKSRLDDQFWKDKSIWVLPLRAGRDYLYDAGCQGNTIQQDFQEIASGGLVDLPYNEQAIPAFVSSVVDSEFGQTSEKVSCNDIFYVDPYLQKMTLRFYRRIGDVGSHVTLTKLDNETGQPLFVLESGVVLESANDLGNMLFDPAKDYRFKKGKEEYEIQNPLPGAWKYELKGVSTADCMRQIEGRKIQFVAEVELLEADAIFAQVAETPYFDKSIEPPMTFTIKLKNSANLQYVESDPNFPLKIRIEWTLPSGKTQLPNGTPIQPYELNYTSDRRWQNENQPILTPEDGTYRLEIVGIAASGDKKTESKELFREVRSFEVKKLESLHFVLQEPPVSGYYACNKLRDGVSVSNPIPIKVQLQNSTDAITYDLNQSFQATLVQADGQELLDTDGKPLTVYLASSGGQTFSGALLENEQNVIGCGQTILRVKFIGTYDENKYAMPQKEISLPMERVEAKGIWLQLQDKESAWLQGADEWTEYPEVLRQEEITEVQTKPLRRYQNTLKACSMENVMPVAFRFQLAQDSDGKKLFAIKDILGKGKTTLYQAKLMGPSYEQNFDLVLKEMETGPVLEGKPAETPRNEGKYTLTITPNPTAFGRGYVAAQDQLVFEFERKDTFFTTLTACRTASGVLTLLGLAFVVLCVLAVTGGPGGTVAFLDDQNDTIFGKGLSSMSITKWWRYRSPTLAERGIKYAQFSRGASTKTSKSVHVKLVDKDGVVFHDSDVPAEMNLPVAEGVSVFYQHPQHKQDDNLI